MEDHGVTKQAFLIHRANKVPKVWIRQNKPKGIIPLPLAVGLLWSRLLSPLVTGCGAARVEKHVVREAEANSVGCCSKRTQDVAIFSMMLYVTSPSGRS